MLAVLGALTLGLDVAMSVEAGSPVMRALGEWWFALSPATLNLAQAVTQRYLLPELWDPVIQTILAWPAWVIFIPLAIVFRWLGRRP